MTLSSIQRCARVTRWAGGSVALGVECWRARSAIWTANEGDARVYFVVSGRSDRILHISRRRALKRSSGGAVVDGCSDIDNSR